MNKFWDLVKQTYRNKSISRTLLNWKIFECCRGLRGVMIDLGGGKEPSYKNYWQLFPSRFIRVDIDPGANPDIIADINKPLPFQSDFTDVVFLFSVIYIIKEPEELLREIFRILKPGGKLFFSCPFIFNESREPDDYLRFTSQGLERLLTAAGFRQYQIMAVGERFTASLYLAEPVVIFKFFKVPLRLIALLLDKLYPEKLKKLHPCPLRYFVKAIK